MRSRTAVLWACGLLAISLGWLAVGVCLARPPAAPLLGYVSDVQFSPDGTRYAVTAGGEVHVYESADGKRVRLFDGEAARYSADGKTLFVMGPRSVTLRDADTGAETKSYPRPKKRPGWQLVSFSPDGTRYAVHLGLAVRLHDTATGFEVFRLDGQQEPNPVAAAFSNGWLETTGKQLLWSPDGNQLLAVRVLYAPSAFGPEVGAAVWDAEAGTMRKHLFSASPISAGYSRPGDRLAVGYPDRVEVWDVGPDPAAKTRRVRTIPTVGPVTAVAFSRDGARLAVGVNRAVPGPVPGGKPGRPAHKSEVLVLDAKSGTELKRLDGFEGGAATTRLHVTALAFHPDGRTLVGGTGFSFGASVPDDAPLAGEVKVWAVEDRPARGRP